MSNSSSNSPTNKDKEKSQEVGYDETRPLRASMDVPEAESFGASPLDGFFKKLELVNEDFQTYLSLTKLLKDKRKTEIEENLSTYESEKISQDAKNMLLSIKFKLQELVKYCNDNPVEPSDSHIRAIQLNSTKKKLLKAIEDSQKAENNYRAQLKKRSIRQFKIAYPAASEEDLSVALDSGSTSHFSQALVDSSRSEEANSTLEQVQERHQDIKRIENSVIELQTLYTQLQNMIELQDPILDKVEGNVDGTNLNLDEANRELGLATNHSKSTKRKRLYLAIFIAIVFILVFAGVILYFSLSTKAKQAAQ